MSREEGEKDTGEQDRENCVNRVKSVKHLERAALAAHRRGERWSTFWAEHGDQVRAVAPHDRAKFQRLYCRLMHLLTTGDPSGQEPPGDVMPWEQDDTQQGGGTFCG